MRVVVLAGVALVLFSSLATAQAPVKLQAHFQGDPLDITSAVGLGFSDPKGVARLLLDSETKADHQLLLKSSRIMVKVLRWEQGPFFSPPKPAWQGLPLPNNQPISAQNATLHLLGIRELPQVLATNGILLDKKMLDADATECRIWNPSHPENLLFPEDPNQVSPPRSYPPGSQQLIAECQAHASVLHQPGRIQIYGLDVLLTSSTGSQTIQTGTFEETDSTGLLKRKVTQILEVRYDGSPLDVQLPFDGTLRMHAERFLGTGKLQTGSASGTLHWGPLSQSGRLEPFAAWGLFQIGWKPDGHMAIDGTTLDGPTMSTLSSNVERSSLSAEAWIALAAGSALLFLFGRLLWPLFTKLSQSEILSHPRRLLILEFVKSQPGVDTTAMARSLGLSWGVTMHHLQTLEHAGQLRRVRVGRRTALFPANGSFRGREVPASLLQREPFKRIYESLSIQPGMDQATLIQRVGLSQQRISRSLYQMKLLGLVSERREGRRLHYFASPKPY